VALGKLGISHTDPQNPRLILDSTAPGVNPGVDILEKTFNPTPADVSATAPEDDVDEDFIGFTVDVKKAHKTIRVRGDEQGLLFFQCMGKLYWYCVCHFGARFSAYWWARVGALLHRLAHRLLWSAHWGWLYVDDSLWKFVRAAAPLHAALVLSLFVAIGVPVSWHKLRFGSGVKWIGLIVRFDAHQWILPEAKLDKVLAFLSAIAQAGDTFPRREMEKGVGLLLWVSGVFSMLRPWLADFYSSLAQATATLISCSREQFAELLQNADEHLRITAPLQLTQVGKDWRLVTIGSTQVHTKAEALNVRPFGQQRTWIRVSNPRSKSVRIPLALHEVAAAWSRALAATPTIKQMRGKPKAAESSAADAFAVGTTVGIGGWFAPTGSKIPEEAYWYRLQFQCNELPPSWDMHAEAQKDISCYEMLAQTGLLAARARAGCLAPFPVTLSQESDNTAAEASANKLFTTASPLRFFVQVNVEVNHIPGANNVYADGLSRGYPSVITQFDPTKEVELSLSSILHWHSI